MTVVDSFVEWAHSGLLQSEEAQGYLLGRGVSSEQWTKHKLGYVIGDYHPNSSLDPAHSEVCKDRNSVHKWCDSCRLARWSSVWETEEDCPVDGPKIQRVGKRIMGFLVLPLTSYSGAVVGFQIRSITTKAFDSFSLMRRPEGHFFGVGPNMDMIWSKKEVFAVEGPFDQLIFERLISKNVVGLTTNTPNASQARFFHRFVNRVGLFLDMDKAGRDGARTFETKMDGGPAVYDFRIDGIKNRAGGKCKDLNEAWSALGDRRFTQHFTEVIKRRL